MSEESIEYEDLRRIIELVAAAPHVRDIRLQGPGIHIELRKQRSAPSPRVVQPEPHPGAQNTARARDGAQVIKSPFVGTFRRARQAGGQPLVEVGDEVSADAAVCMVEVLGELNAIRAGRSGIVLEIPLGDGAPVEFGQTLAVTRSLA
jgi:biotin carboxyl carrier protein